MKVIYYSNPSFADCDFPLIKEMQKRKIDVRFYMPIGHKLSNVSIIELDEPICTWGIHKASKFKCMSKYKDCIDLNKLYFICGINRIWWPFTWFLWIWVYFHMLLFKADVLHFTWQLLGIEKIMFHIPYIAKKIMTVHDPLQHSGTLNEQKQDKARKRCFQWSDKLILLNSQQLDIFSKKYNIDKNKIYVSRLGVYDSIKYLKADQRKNDCPYVLFFGQFFPYKGIEYLLDAMLKVREECPCVDVVIAGRGEIYFDMSKYKDKQYIKIENRYIGISELVSLVKNSLLVVCPYKDATQSGVVQTAFALGIPIVATNVGALPEVVKNDVYGKIVPACDADALAVAMIELIKDTNKLNRLKHNIISNWIPSMSWSPIVDGYINIYGN